MDIKEQLKANAENLARGFLDEARDHKSFECPKCGRGGAGSKHRDGIKLGAGGLFGCYSCDFKGGDIIDLYMGKNNVDYKTAVSELGAMMSLVPPAAQVKKPAPSKTAEQVIAEFEQLPMVDMPKAYRGISKETLNRYGVKYCQKFINPKIAGTFKGARKAVVFPTSNGRYFVRACEPKQTELCDRWDIGGKEPFNLAALKSGRSVFVVEGVIDALSIIEAGGEAIGLSGIDGIGGLVSALKSSPSPNGLLLAADNDEAGAKGAAVWASKLKEIGVECEVVDTAKLYGGKKDANEALQSDSKSFRQRVAELSTHEAAVVNPWAGSFSGFVERIAGGDYKPIPTGIKCIDDLLGGGFVAKQLVVIGAPPAMGKTAFCQWLVEKTGKAALYFCFEMARDQLQARGISRVLFEHGKDLSAMEVMQGRGCWREGVELYKQEIAGNVAYFGLGSGLHSSDINEMLRIMQDGVKYRASIGEPSPLVVVDYLQLLRAGGKDESENLQAVMERLKEFAVRNGTVVIGIVANNRESNKAGGVSMYSGRGGSSIEYGADIVLGLTYTEILDQQEEVTHKDKVSLVMTKGRFAQKDSRVDFTFDGRHTTFIPAETWSKPVPKKQQREISSLLDFKSAVKGVKQ